MFFPSSNQRQRSRYRSKRSVERQRDVPTHLVTHWTRTKIILVSAATCALATVTMVPIIILETSLNDSHNQPKFNAPVSLHNLIAKSVEVEQLYKKKGMSLWQKAKTSLHVHIPGDPISHVDPADDVNTPKPQDSSEQSSPKAKRKAAARIKLEERETVAKGEDVARPSKNKQQQLARGVSGLPMSQTPALVGARPGHIECDLDIDDIVYWNDPQGSRDQEFVSPYATPADHYLTFQPDPGGWNNIRMSMEIIFVLAAATGRTLVLPPKVPFYLLGMGKDSAKSFGNFFPLEHAEFQKRVNVITMEEFLDREGKVLLNLSDEQMATLKPVAQTCIHQPHSEINCDLLYQHLQTVGVQPDAEAASKNCFVFDQDYFEGRPVSEDVKQRVDRFCGEKREPLYYDNSLHEPKLIHWDAEAREHRLLNHFYAFVYFTDPAIDNYYKRFVRDFLHYKDKLYCAAGKIIHALNQEGPWSSMHVRRGDFQYKAVKFSSQEWYDNTKEIWNENEILFVATDERNKTFFDDLKKHHQVRFLDDYWDMAKLGDLDSNFLGMIDTIVASHGRAFAGTWFSTFTGYINRMRGYLGHPMENSWYGWLERKDAMQNWTFPEGNYPAREWPIGWVAIDGDEVIEHEGAPVAEEQEKKQTQGLSREVKVGLSDMTTDAGFRDKPTKRGLAGRPMSETPSLVGASRAHVKCDVNVDSLAYWNDPQGTKDQEFVSPFRAQGDEKYITFTIDRGGWNNVRMSMEIIFVIAAATGRTLVLPPKEPLYRLRADTENIYRGFADFFPLETPEFAKRVNMISMEEFVKRQTGPNGSVPIPEEMRDNVINSAEHCDKRAKSKSYCGHIAEFLADVGYVPDARAQDYCVVFDKDLYEGKELSSMSEASISKFCGERTRAYWTADFEDKPLIHFRAGEKQWRLLTHFYGFIHFTDPAIVNYYKRFVRDFLHYNDQIYCAAGKIVKALQVEGKQRGFDVDEEGGGGYSAMHIRRGDFQYKKVKIPAEEWYENTKEIWEPKEILFIATDERNKTFFDPIAKFHDVRFLDDYFELAGLANIDPNFFGMIDTIISSQARAFAGTWFSTFTGYINRMRGYHGMTMTDSWYSFLERKTSMHIWKDIDHFAYAYEWPDGWIGIDAEVAPTKDIF